MSAETVAVVEGVPCQDLHDSPEVPCVGYECDRPVVALLTHSGRCPETICAAHADRARRLILTAILDPMRPVFCSVCGSKNIDPTSVNVRPI